MKVRTDFMILGGGPAGITFGRNLRKLRPETRVTMLRPEQFSMVYCAIPYAIEGTVDPAKVYKRDALVTDAGIDLVRRSAVRVDLGTKEVEDSEGQIYEYGKLFIATGASPVRPPIPGTHASNVYTVKTQQDMERLIGKIGDGARQAVVVGAGAIGIEQAQAYRTKGLAVHLVDMASHVLPNMLDQGLADLVQKTLEDNGIRLSLGVRLERLELEGSSVGKVTLSDGEIIELDAERDFVCFAIGMKPDIDLFRGQGMEIAADGIVVDSRMQTNIPDVYAAGDCCSYLSAIDGKPIGGKLATNAVPMGKITARVLAGREADYPGFYNGAATCAFQWRIGSTGFTEETARARGMETISGEAETSTLFPMMPGAGKLRVKVVADARNHRIIGGQVLSELPAADKVDVLTLALQQRMTLEDLAGLSYCAQPWQSFFPARSALVDACESALTPVPVA